MADPTINNRFIDAKGALFVPELMVEFKTGETYAIAYTSPKPTMTWKVFSKAQKVPTGIAISEYNDLFKDGAVCNVNEG
jgi:hypothetical protein